MADTDSLPAAPAAAPHPRHAGATAINPHPAPPGQPLPPAGDAAALFQRAQALLPDRTRRGTT